MKSRLYLALVLIGVSVFLLTFLNAGRLSEQQLIDRILYWYIPIVFGLNGFAATRLAKIIGPEDNRPVAHHFFGSGDPQLSLVSKVLTVLSGFLGIILILIPLGIFNPQSKIYALAVAIVGTSLWLLALLLFFLVVWPGL